MAYGASNVSPLEAVYLLRERSKGRRFRANEMINRSHIFYAVDSDGIK
jgi:hypothetical protein